MTVLVNCFTTNEPLDLQEKSECPVIQEQLVLGELELMDYSWFSQACMVSSDKEPPRANNKGLRDYFNHFYSDLYVLVFFTKDSFSNVGEDRKVRVLSVRQRDGPSGLFFPR